MKNSQYSYMNALSYNGIYNELFIFASEFNMNNEKIFSKLMIYSHIYFEILVIYSYIIYILLYSLFYLSLPVR